MTPETFYIIDTSKIVFEKFEDETVLINLSNGNYFGIRNVGMDVLKLLEKGISKVQLLGILTNSYKKDQNEIDADIQTFLELLLTEGIIQISAVGLTEFPFIEEKGGYSKPILDKYSDMQDLILLDPVHDVSSKGWPNVKDETNTQPKS
jgi:hypothetical protein